MRLKPFIPVKPRRRRVHNAQAPAVESSARILAVRHSEVDGDRLIVSLSVPLESWGSVSQMLECSVDGVTWVAADGVDDPEGVTLMFPADVTDATLWRVPNTDAWVLAGGVALGPPLSGGIE